MKGELLPTYLLFTISADRFLARLTSGSYHFLELVNKSINEFGGKRAIVLTGRPEITVTYV